MYDNCKTFSKNILLQSVFVKLIHIDEAEMYYGNLHRKGRRKMQYSISFVFDVLKDFSTYLEQIPCYS